MNGPFSPKAVFSRGSGGNVKEATKSNRILAGLMGFFPLCRQAVRELAVLNPVFLGEARPFPSTGNCISVASGCGYAPSPMWPWVFVPGQLTPGGRMSRKKANARGFCPGEGFKFETLSVYNLALHFAACKSGCFQTQNVDHL